MNKARVLLFTGTLTLGGATTVFGDEGHEQSVKMKDLPAAVQETFKREAKGGQIEELQKETKNDGRIVYEAEIVKNGEGTDIEVGMDGTVLERGDTHDEASEHDKD